MKSVKTLGFIGLGVMGEGMCSNVVRKSNLPVYGADLNKEPLERVAKEGLIVCDSIGEVARNADVIFLSLPSHVQVEAVCEELLGMVTANEGVRVSIVVDMSTSSVSKTREIAEMLKEQGIEYLDAPVARLREAARLGTLSIMIGGNKDVFETVKPYLECMGTDLTYCGAVGNGQVVKILNNMVVFMNVYALAEALSIGRENGVDGQVLFDVMSLGSADSFMLRNAGMKSLAIDDFPLKAFPTNYALKDMSLALELADNAKLRSRLANLTNEILGKTKAAGFADNYYPAMIKVIENDFQI
ncbi:MAG: NAD(P)-dependent oxidoreductase [Methylocystaceae bacterium]|nr:NAD(P)-dependent oxidoreductase [Methylocystaceae bacterium]